MEKALGETQTLRAGSSNAEPKIFAPPQTPFSGAQDDQNLNQLDMVTTFTYKPSLVKIDISSYRGNRPTPPARPLQTHRTDKKKKKKNLFSKFAYKISNKKSRNGRLPERPYGHPGWRP